MGNARAIENRGHGIAFYGENGTLVITRREWEVYAENKRIEHPPQVDGEAEIRMFIRHAAQFLDCVKTRHLSNADIEVGHRSTSACQLGNVALRVGRKVRWDADKEEIVDDHEASTYLTRDYRKPYELPQV